MTVFADTFYFMAILNKKDSAHATAIEHSNGPGRVLTTEWVSTELADGMASRRKRQSFPELCDLLRSDPEVEIVPADTDLFSDGVKLYRSRPDKDWFLTDCMSILVMQRRGITDALTGDQHFEQAGFRALLRQ